MAKKNNKKYESGLEVFQRNFIENPGFKALVQLIGIIIFFAVIVLVSKFGGEEQKETLTNNDNTEITTTVPESPKKTYYDYLLDLENNKKKITAVISINDMSYNLSMESEKGILSGYLETKTKTSKFKIEEDKIYEVKLEEEIENDKLFEGINLDYIVIEKLTEMLSNNKATKQLIDDTIVYDYELEGKTIKVTTKDQIDLVEITEGNNIYKLTFE